MARIACKQIKHSHYASVRSQIKLRCCIRYRAPITPCIYRNLCGLRHYIAYIQVAHTIEPRHIGRNLCQRTQNQTRLWVLRLCKQAHQAIVAVGFGKDSRVYPVHRLPCWYAVGINQAALLAGWHSLHKLAHGSLRHAAIGSKLQVR